MVTVCPLCEDSHPVDECPHLRAEATWADRREDAGPLAEDDLEGLRGVLAARALGPLVRTLAEAQREVGVLETVNTDDDQRRRLSRSRKLIKAIRHVRHRRMELVEAELEEATRISRGDPLVDFVTGFVRTVEGRPEDAIERFDAVDQLDADDDTLGDFDGCRLRLDAWMGSGRNLMLLGRFDEARARFEQVVEGGVGDERAEARYQIARCLLAGAGGGAVP